MMSAAATKTKPRVMSRGGIIACMVLTLLTPVGLLLIHLARGNAEEVEHLYSRGFYHGMATVLTALTGRVPFSVMPLRWCSLFFGYGKPSGRKDAGGWYA